MFETKMPEQNKIYWFLEILQKQTSFRTSYTERINLQNNVVESGLNRKTLGIKTDPIMQVEYHNKGLGLPPKKITNLKEYGTAVYTYYIETINSQYMKEKDWKRTILIGYPSNINVKLSKVTKLYIDNAINLGIFSVRNYFNESLIGNKIRE